MSEEPQIFHFQGKRYDVSKRSEEVIIRINDSLSAKKELDQVVVVSKTLQARIQSLESVICNMLPEPMAT